VPVSSGLRLSLQLFLPDVWNGSEERYRYTLGSHNITLPYKRATRWRSWYIQFNCKLTGVVMQSTEVQCSKTSRLSLLSKSWRGFAESGSGSPYRHQYATITNVCQWWLYYTKWHEKYNKYLLQFTFHSHAYVVQRQKALLNHFMRSAQKEIDKIWISKSINHLLPKGGGAS